jgi:ribonucleoside-diphosphate reductase alpha chain
MGSTESFEAITSNIFSRRTLAGEFVVVNKYLVNDLIKIGLWNKTMKERIIAGDGSVQQINEIPEATRALYKTVWEIKQRVVIDMAAARVPYVCQTQSMNLYVEDTDLAKMTNMHFYGWKKGLKTGVYYTRTRPKAKTMAFSIDPRLAASKGVSAAIADAKPTEEEVAACSRENPEGCLMCSA